MNAGLSAQSGKSGQSEVSDICDYSHAESEAEVPDGSGGTCEYLMRTVTRALLELQEAIEAEQVHTFACFFVLSSSPSPRLLAVALLSAPLSLLPAFP